MRITHAGYDQTQAEWGLWAVDKTGQEWFIPTDESTCRRLVDEQRDTDVQDFPTNQGE